jgi:hypothetical protein
MCIPVLLSLTIQSADWCEVPKMLYLVPPTEPLSRSFAGGSASTLGVESGCSGKAKKTLNREKLTHAVVIQTFISLLLGFAAVTAISLQHARVMKGPPVQERGNGVLAFRILAVLTDGDSRFAL